MDFRILGPLEVVADEQPLALGGIKQRSLLAVLLQHANEVVSTDHLLAELWGDAPPATAAKSIQVYVHRLRRLLGPDRLVTRPPGYALRVEESELDLAAFERLRGEDRPREALALWRGPAYADLAYEPCVQGERARLQEQRLVALEERIDADLAAGRHADLVSELEALIAREPLRERLRGQLMLGLYRSARQADALAVYRAARRELAGELGLEPGAELRRLERAILQQDPALELPAEMAGEHSLLVVPSSPARVDGVLGLAALLGMPLVLACVVPAAEVGTATATLAARARDLTAARSAAFSSPEPGADLVRLAERERCELILMDGAPLEGAVRVVLETARCDVGALIGGAPRDGPVLVPFGAGRHDWAALELGARVARATGAPLRLMGAVSGRHARDASRLLADASLIVQRRSGVVAEPLLARPGRRGVIALAEVAGLLVVGVPDGWREDGLGRVRSALVADPPAPTVLVRRGAAEQAPALTRFTWSLTGSVA
jgi:DNA-binding SARP family transcriptional activator